MVLSTTLKHIMDGYSGRLEVFNDHFDDGITDDMAKLLDDIERLQHESRCKLNDLVTKISKRHGKPEVDQPWQAKWVRPLTKTAGLFTPWFATLSMAS
jgi:hypothetical protein